MPKSFAYCKRWLRKNFPSKLEYRVALVSQETINRYRRERGDYTYKEDTGWPGYIVGWGYNDGKTRFTILIDKCQCETQRIHTLLHEHAHLLQFHVPHAHKEPHGPTFNKYHKRILRKWDAL